MPIKLPPLRERLEDIPLLARHFLAHYWERHRQAGAAPPDLTPDAIRSLQTRPWRGNVRELQNVIEHVAVIAETNRPIGPDDIPLYDDEGPKAGAAPAAIGAELMHDTYHSAKDKLVAQFEQAYLGRLVARTGGNMSKAARLAGIDRTTLYRLMDKHGISRGELSGA